MILDNFGEWKNLGEIQPSLDWQIFPEFAGNGEIFWLNFSEKSSTHYGYIRAIYWSGSQYIFDNSWIKIFPKDEPEIIVYPFPKTFRGKGVNQRQIQVKKRPRYRASVVYDTDWNISILELQGSNESSNAICNTLPKELPAFSNNFPIIGTFDVASSGDLPIQLL
jgi:hypothetical protein